MKDHRLIDARSLAFGQAIAARLHNHPELVEEARRTLSRWLTTCSEGSRTTLQEWAAVLEGPLQGVIALLTDTDERATRLRQSSPFAGLLSQEERNTILLQFQSYDQAPT